MWRTIKKTSLRRTYSNSGKISFTSWTLLVANTQVKKLFKNLAVIKIESWCVQEETLKDTNTITWIKKLLPISVSISSNNVNEPIFSSNSDPHRLLASFMGSVRSLALQSKTEMKLLFVGLRLKKNNKLGSILEILNQRHNLREQASLDDCDNERCASTQFPQIQKNQLVDLQDFSESYCKVLPVLNFHSGRVDFSPIKSFLLRIPVNER